MKQPQKSNFKFYLAFALVFGVGWAFMKSVYLALFNGAALFVIIGILGLAVIVAIVRPRPRLKPQVTTAPKGVGLRLFSSDDGVISLEVTNQNSNAVLVPDVELFMVVSVHYGGMPALGGNGMSNVKITFDAGPIGMLGGGTSKIYEVSGPNTPVAIIERLQNLRQFSNETDERFARRKTQSERLKARINADFAAAPSLAHLVEDNSGPYYLEAKLEGGKKSAGLPRKSA